MLISHHGVPEFGSAVRPMCLEAQVLAALDDLDAKVNQISCAVSQVEKGGFSEKMWALDQRRFYNFNGLEVPKADILNQKEETILEKLYSLGAPAPSAGKLPVFWPNSIRTAGRFLF